MAIGDIGALIDTHTFDSTRGSTPSLIQILDNLHCITYSGPDWKGWSKSINITAAGAISEPANNSLKWLDANSQNMRSCLRPSNVHVFAYHDEPDDAFIEAVIVNADGTLSQHANHVALFADRDCLRFDAIHVSGSTVAIAYDKNSGLVHVITWAVAANGYVAATLTQDFEVHNLLSGYAQIEDFGGGDFIVTYQKGDGFGYGRMITISDAGVIAFGLQPQGAFTDRLYSWPHVIKLQWNICIAVFESTGNEGWAAVFKLSAQGLIVVPTNNLYKFDASNCERPRAIAISGNVFGVVYRGAGDDGFLKTIKCEVNGAATWTPIGELEFEETDITYPIINHRAGNTYIISYADANDHGIMKTIGIETPTVERPHHEMIMGMGP